ncbi:hypothetical protein JTB14_007852 [Gonioctena quinquepunctata]|nr:hypothetical protein JTB14_007852 [Gonioctena quinquepunctata]
MGEGVVDLPITIENIVQIVPTLIVPTFHLFILESDFCDQFKIKIYFHNSIVNSKVLGSPVEVISNENSRLNWFITENSINPLELNGLEDLLTDQRQEAEEVIKSFEEISRLD